MNKRKIVEEIQENIAYNESSLDNIYSTPLTEGGMDFLAQNINDITFFEERINEDLDELDFWEEEDPVVMKFFGIKSSKDE